MRRKGLGAALDGQVAVLWIQEETAGVSRPLSLPLAVLPGHQLRGCVVDVAAVADLCKSLGRRGGCHRRLSAVQDSAAAKSASQQRPTAELEDESMNRSAATLASPVSGFAHASLAVVTTISPVRLLKQTAPSVIFDF